MSADGFRGIRLTAISGLCLVIVSGIFGCGADRSCDPGGKPCSPNPPYSALTLIGDLYSYCFKECDDCRGRAVDLQLYLDTVNLPSNNVEIQKLVLSSLPTTPIAGRDRLEFFFEGTLPDSIDPGILDQIGWKVRVTGATIGYCSDCYNDCGWVPILHITGSLDDVGFLYDPADTAGIYIKVELGCSE